ncbi:restriction endonuclease [Spirosoma daeguense]
MSSRGGRITVLAECKKYKTPVKREKVEILYSRLQSLGAHKGMIFSTSGFQLGAIEFAAKHGIALVRLREGKFSYETKSHDHRVIEIPPWADCQNTKVFTFTMLRIRSVRFHICNQDICLP